MSPDHTSLNSAPPINQGLSQSYLNLIADSADYNDQDGSDAWSLPVGVATREGSVPEGCTNGQLVSNPPDLISEFVPRKTAPTSLDLSARGKWREEEEEELSNNSDERAKVKRSHSRTKQRNTRCLETEV